MPPDLHIKPVTSNQQRTLTLGDYKREQSTAVGDGPDGVAGPQDVGRVEGIVAPPVKGISSRSGMWTVGVYLLVAGERKDRAPV